LCQQSEAIPFIYSKPFTTRLSTWTSYSFPADTVVGTQSICDRWRNAKVTLKDLLSLPLDLVQARYQELSKMAEEFIRADAEYWRELEALSGQRQHFKPGLTGETAIADDELAA
jgi:hypothetical protein